MWSMKLRAVAGSCPPLEQADEPPAREILIDGQAMLRVARDGAPKPILGNHDINALAA
jgi:hypothetical protein